MRKIILLFFSLVLMSSVLFGCQSQNNSELISDREIKQISISKSSGFGKVNLDFFAVFEDEETLEIFRTVLSRAVRQEGIVDMVEPEFDLEVVYKNGDKEGFHLWIGQKGEKSTLMNVDSTHTIYTVSEELTNRLIDIIK